MAGSSAAAAAAAGWFNGRGMWEASIASHEGDVRRRPYHRNCSCALHRSRAIPAGAPCPSSSSVSYPVRHRSSSWHSLTASFSSTNLAAADANPRVSIDGHATVGGATAVAFMVDAEDY